ncbi:hypothetical protein B0H19DRAFT_1263807 [Mycena capillaripes]|nr:hypothetical protein B0H19DRAFT_1263807 [Mycena capillaripes]
MVNAARQSREANGHGIAHAGRNGLKSTRFIVSAGRAWVTHLRLCAMRAEVLAARAAESFGSNAACFAHLKDSVREEQKSGLRAPQNHLDLSPPLSQRGGGERTAAHRRRPQRTQYVIIDNDIIPDIVTQRKLRAHTPLWRGVSALEPEPSPHIQGHTPLSSIHHRPRFDAAASQRTVRIILGFGVRLRRSTAD